MHIMASLGGNLLSALTGNAKKDQGPIKAFQTAADQFKRLFWEAVKHRTV